MAQGTTTVSATENNAPNVSLSDAVKDAFDKNGIDPDAELKPDHATGETKVIKKDEKSKTAEPEKTAETDKEVEDTFEVDASQEEIGHALALHRALADPKSRAGIIAQLAEKAGYDLGSKKEVKQLSEDIEEILKESLGDSYDLLSGPQLAKAIDRVLDVRVKKLVDPVVERLNASEMKAQQEQANASLATLWERQKVDPKERTKVADLMLKKMNQVRPGEGVSADEYLDDIYSLVQRDVEKARAVKTTVRRITQNAQDVNRTSGDGGTDDKRVKTGSKLPSISEAVAAAWRGETLED